jgi:hypothetical protein
MGSLDAVVKVASPTGVETARREARSKITTSVAATDVSKCLTVLIFRI